MLSPIPRAFSTAHRRSFVSTVLLSRTWENVTVVELRKEAKARGLSTTGNKSTLIARIQEHEKNTTSPPTHTPAAARSATTNAVPPVTPKMTSQAVSPGIPLVAQPNGTSTIPDFLAIKLPNLFQPPLNPSVQVPYVPDFWNSARPKADAPIELEPPKLHVVSGFITRYDGGPVHGLETRQGDSPSTTVQVDIQPISKEIGFWADLWESVGLPRSFSVRRTLSEADNLVARAGEDEYRNRSRPLTDEERKGLYILLGIVGGSWLVAGLMNRPTVVAEVHGAQDQH